MSISSFLQATLSSSVIQKISSPHTLLGLTRPSIPSARSVGSHRFISQDLTPMESQSRLSVSSQGHWTTSRSKATMVRTGKCRTKRPVLPPSLKSDVKRSNSNIVMAQTKSHLSNHRERNNRGKISKAFSA